MHCFEMQDWVTIRGGKTITEITQSEHRWVDLAEYRDVVLWTEIVQATGTNTFLSFETSPSKDDSLFAQAVAPFATANGSTTVSVVHRDTASIPLARWLRWTLTHTAGSVAWDVQFRVWIAAARDRSGGP